MATHDSMPNSSVVDPLFELIAYDPIAVPSSDDDMRGLEASFSRAWSESRSPSALILALEGLPADEQRRWIRDVVFALEGFHDLFRRLADLHRRSEAGTLGVYNGPAFDRARGVVGMVAGWERFRVSTDPAERHRILGEACDVIRGLERGHRPSYRAILVERARWGRYPEYESYHSKH